MVDQPAAVGVLQAATDLHQVLQNQGLIGPLGGDEQVGPGDIFEGEEEVPGILDLTEVVDLRQIGVTQLRQRLELVTEEADELL